MRETISRIHDVSATGRLTFRVSLAFYCRNFVNVYRDHDELLSITGNHPTGRFEGPLLRSG